MNYKTSNSIVVHVLMIGIAIFALMPLVWMVSVSFMAAGEAGSLPLPLLPNRATLDNYRQLFNENGMWRFLRNSVMFSTAITLTSVLLNSAAGYAFAQLRFKGKDTIFKMMIASLVIPGQVAMLPLFLIMKELGLVNSPFGVIVPGMASIFGIFLIRQNALSIPSDFFDAARVDGASEWTIFSKIVFPLLKPAVVTLAVFTFLGSWNDFMWPLIVLTGDEFQNLPLALASMSREHVKDVELMMAGAVVTILPILLLFLMLQRYYVEGIMSGGVKG